MKFAFPEVSLNSTISTQPPMDSFCSLVQGLPVPSKVHLPALSSLIINWVRISC